MFIVANSPGVNKILDFVIHFSKYDILIIITGNVVDDHFNFILNYFYLVFNGPVEEAFCRLISSTHILGFPTDLTQITLENIVPIMTLDQISVPAFSVHLSHRFKHQVVVSATFFSSTLLMLHVCSTI